jgi:hypothetical protein
MTLRRNLPLTLIAALALLVAAAPASAATPASYLRSTQNADGGFGMTRAGASGEFATGWALLGLAAAGQNPRDVRVGRRSGIDYLRANMRAVRDIGEIERTILVVRAAGLSPRRFAGRDLVREVMRRQRAGGTISGYVSYTSFGIMALRAGGLSASSRTVRRAAAWLARQQNADGGFSVRARGGASTIDDTGYVIQALAAAGRGSTRGVRRAASFIAARQNADGGFPLSPGAASNAQSTAYAVQGLVAARRNIAFIRRGGRTPTAYLESLTQRDGVVRYSRTTVQTPVWVTAQALAAISRKPFPLRPVRRR